MRETALDVFYFADGFYAGDVPRESVDGRSSFDEDACSEEQAGYGDPHGLA